MGKKAKVTIEEDGRDPIVIEGKFIDYNIHFDKSKEYENGVINGIVLKENSMVCNIKLYNDIIYRNVEYL